MSRRNRTTTSRSGSVRRAAEGNGCTAGAPVIPILFRAQLTFIVAFGVLLDTFVVRSLLVPALVHDVGRAVWWPSTLSRAER